MARKQTEEQEDLWYGKMFPELSAPTEEETSEPSCTKSLKSQSQKPPLFLCLKTDGPQADALLTWQEDGALLGEYSTHSFGECPKDAVESRLSEILEGIPHPRYYLSATACKGVLNRANRREKDLPELLKDALEIQSHIERPVTRKLHLMGEDVCYTLNTVDRPAVCAGFKYLESAKARGLGYEEEKSHSLTARALDEAVVVYDARGNGSGGVCPTLTGDHQDRVTDYTALCVGNGQMCNITMKPIANTLDTMHEQQAIICLDKSAYNSGKKANIPLQLDEDGKRFTLTRTDHPPVVMAVDCRNGTLQEVNGTLQSKSSGGTNLNTNNVVLSEVTGTLSPGAHPGGFNGQDAYQNLLALSPCVRRLTPLECERLQGFPDFWSLIGKPIGYEKYTFTDTGETWIDTIYEYTDSTGKKRKTSDSARYKALGNSIAIPPWTYVLSRLRRYLPENPTMASLFDGIGGFPLIGMRVGIKPVWASEIEEFCISVTKERFGED